MTFMIIVMLASNASWIALPTMELVCLFNPSVQIVLECCGIFNFLEPLSSC